MLKRIIIAGVFLSLAVGCASQRPATVTSQSRESQRPRWVDTPPSSPEFFYGVGAAPGAYDPAEDRQTADRAARIDIASQLKIKMSSVVADLMQYKQTYTGKKTREEYSQQYSQKISAIVDTTALEGSKIVQRWHDPQADTYYSLASMSKAEFRARIKRQIENAQNLARDQYRHALEAQETANITAALRYYANALTELEVLQDIPFEVDLDGDGTEEYFRPEVKRKIEELVTGLQILTINNNQKGKVGKPLLKSLIAKVFYKKMPVKDVPLVFAFVRGKGQLDERVQTNTKGLASSRVYRLESVGTDVVEVRAELAEIMGVGGVRVLKGVEVPRTRFSFQAEAVKVVVRISEENIGVPVLDSYVEAAILAELTGVGFAVISPEEAKRQVSVAGIEQAMGGNYQTVQRAAKKLGAEVVIVGRVSTIFSSQ
ncbi:MAG: LPP20 family lipoprotein, partial [Candidatus Latescibacteria bacterium]|nr:LPP20 family lipoprotein [Candidatus Latescibacterota bacterium]